MSRVPPQDLDAEAVILGELMVNDRAFDDVAHLLKPEHFYADANATVFRAVLDLNATGKPWDAVAVAGWLRDRKLLDRVGGATYIAVLTDAPITGKLELVAGRIVELWRLRAVIREAQALEAEAYAMPHDIPAFVQAAEARMYAAAGQSVREIRGKTAREVMKDCTAEIARRHRSESPAGFSTGFGALDSRINRLQKERVYVVAARPGMGKTSLVTQLIGSVATSGDPNRGVFMASLEMPCEQIGERLLAQEAKLDTRKLERGWLTRSEWDDMLEKGKGVAGWPLVIDDTAGITVGGIRSAIRRAVRTLREKYDVGLGMVAIDYFQLLGTSDLPWGGSTNDTLEELSKRILNGIAKEFKVPVLLLSQLNRECEKRPGKRPQLSDLRGSGALEQDAHTIMFLFRGDQYLAAGQAKDRSAEIIIAKCRGGRCGTVNLSYLEYCTKFIDDGERDADDELEQYRRDAEELGMIGEDVDPRHDRPTVQEEIGYS